MIRVLILLILCSFGGVLQAYDSLDIELGNGFEINVTRFQGEGKTLFLWLPSERGFGQGYIPVALNLQALDYDLWTVNLHETYIIPTGRDSLAEIDLDDLVELFTLAKLQGFEEVFIVTSGRGMSVALESSYLWQRQNPRDDLIKGLLVFSPHIVKGRTEMGQDARYLDISSYSNLPVYLLQAQHSVKFSRSREIARQLAGGGSQVFVHYLAGVQGGFHMRPVEDLTPQDLEVRAQLDEIFSAAIGLLRQVPSAPLRAGYDPQAQDRIKILSKAARLYPFTGDPSPPQLVLQDLSGNYFDLQAATDQVVLVNFWATWCGPCVEEIPSLSRLVARLEGQPFKVVAVNIGESAKSIRQFVKEIPVNFDILLDSHGDAVRDWKVYAYPSNYLIDRDGRIQYAYRGALQWDSPQVVETIESLLTTRSVAPQ
jgi:thiol-disulfide isomerase/thioredoxin